MDFSLTQAQNELSALARQILADRATPDRLAEAGEAGFDPSLWHDLASAGLLSAALPEAVGGDGYGLAEQCSVLAEIGRAVAPVPYLESITVGASALAAFGTPDQQMWGGTKAAKGGLIVTAALAEPGKDDPRRPATRAERADGGWRLTGSKTTVPAGAFAGLFLVPAATQDGTAVFGVKPDDQGVGLERQHLTGGHGAATLDLAGVELGEDRLLGRPGDDVAGWLADRATIGTCALQLGVTERALELTAQYAQSREQFGRPIGAFQAVAQRLADAWIDVEAIRLTLWQAAWRLQSGLPAAEEIATAKFWAADGGHRVAHTAVHLHGGVGVDISHPLHRYFLAAKHNEFALGGATAHLRRLGAALAAG